ncbi:nucleolar protein 8 [Rhodotorula toruloides]|uniref:Nucleolar protein 8 n=1 Tax=Rhodotorula toruloides TaxID=5286 RepID=A0A511KJ89_RHOTO|nr:nucleolar protein 8 [Rhodotorula toruloides]
MAPVAALPTAPVTKRVHVGGLAPSVSPRDLVQRFSSFGTVVGGEKGVDGLGKTDTGLHRSFAFFSLETTEAKFARCMSMLNGSMWKAHKLRIGPAKPDWQTRLASEREEAEKGGGGSTGRPKKRKKASKDPNVGKLAPHFELVTPENIERHRGWVLDPKPTPAPIFPLILRPSHPVAPPPEAAKTAWSRGTAKAKPSKAARASQRAGSVAMRPAPTRIKRMRIDPRRWGRKRIVFDVLRATGKDVGANMCAIGTWECEEPEEPAPGADPEVTWVFKTRDGQVRRRETVRLTQRSAPYTDRFTAMLDRMNQSTSTATLASKLEPARTPSISQTKPAAASSANPTQPHPPERSASPPPYIAAAPRTLIYNEEDAFQLMAASLDDAERDVAHAMERAALRQFAIGALAEIVPDAYEEVDEEAPALPITVQSERLPQVEGFAQEDDDDSDLFAALPANRTLRLRGGGPSSDSDSDSDSDASSSDSDESKSADDEEEPAKNEASSSAAAPAPSSKSALSSIFKTRDTSTDGGESGGFSLLAGMDLDLVPLERTPSPPPAPAVSLPQQPRFVAPPTRDGGYRTQHGPAGQAFKGPSKAFFAFPSGGFEDRRTGEFDEAKVAKLDEMMRSRVEKAAEESRQRIAEGSKDFWRHESQERIDEEHQKLRETLRGFARKRHREAAKRSKRTGGRRGTGPKLDIIDDE